jgi:toxin-antitoxin system PIN domain toxin
MVRALFDINVLLALFDAEHIHHRQALAWWSDNRDGGWASCPLTQNGFVRVISGARYPRARSFADAMAVMRAQIEQSDHAFWVDDISIADAGIFDHGRLFGPNQITDVYLLALALKNGGRFVTFDRAVPVRAVRDAGPQHLVTLE